MAFRSRYKHHALCPLADAWHPDYAKIEKCLCFNGKMAWEGAQDELPIDETGNHIRRRKPRLDEYEAGVRDDED